jgi:hypothetical protein
MGAISASRCALQDISHSLAENKEENLKNWSGGVVTREYMGVLDSIFKDKSFKFKRVKPFIGNIDDLLNLD